MGIMYGLRLPRERVSFREGNICEQTLNENPKQGTPRIR